MSMVWKPIVGFEDCGEVSNTGLIRNKHGLIRKTTVAKNGYERVGFHGGQETVFVHRLVARAFCDGYADGLLVNHKDGDKLNNNAENLEWVTQSENIKHAYAIGNKTYAHPNTIISDDEFKKVLVRRANGETQQSIANDYGVTRGAIGNRITRMKEAEHCQR